MDDRQLERLDILAELETLLAKVTDSADMRRGIRRAMNIVEDRCTPEEPQRVSGDFCGFAKDMPASCIEHYRCDEWPDGTITDNTLRGGKLVVRMGTGPKGFDR